MEALGINFTNLGINTVLFLILYFVVDRLLISKLTKSISERQKRIIEAEKSFAETKSLYEKAKDDHARIIKEAKQDSENIVRAAKVQSELESQRAIKKSYEEGQLLLSNFEESLKKREAEISTKYNQEFEKTVKETLNRLLKSTPEQKLKNLTTDQHEE